MNKKMEQMRLTNWWRERVIHSIEIAS